FGSTLAIHNHLISPTQWMILIGLGLYLIYIPFNSIFFERFISSFKIVGNVGFLIYVADSVGYVGSISTMVIKSFFKTNMNWFHFLSWQMQYFSLVGIIFTIACFYYLYKKRTLIG
ncbi:MAG: DUF5690 family protein, partial [Sediminibacterium sp.]|nr:DUF5690 family protein [Sediminibacterium sp.]